MINRIRDIRKQKGWTLADLAEACDPPTTPQTVGRLETGMRNLSLKWMERIAAALEVDPEMLVRSEKADHPQVVAALAKDGPEALPATRDALLAAPPTSPGLAAPGHPSESAPAFAALPAAAACRLPGPVWGPYRQGTQWPQCTPQELLGGHP
mgnify:CR=1 FL=1